MHTPWKLPAALILLSTSVFAASPFSSEEPKPHRLGRLWKASLLALAAGTAVDAASSWNRPEANPILRNTTGQFGAQGVGIKIALAGSVAVAQYFLARKGPQGERAAIVMNFTTAGVFSAATVHNLSQPSPTAVK